MQLFPIKYVKMMLYTFLKSQVSYYFNTQKSLKSKFQMVKYILFVSMFLVPSEMRFQSCPKETVEKYFMIKLQIHWTQLLTVTFKTLRLLQGSINTLKRVFILIKKKKRDIYHSINIIHINRKNDNFQNKSLSILFLLHTHRDVHLRENNFSQLPL